MANGGVKITAQVEFGTSNLISGFADGFSDKAVQSLLDDAAEVVKQGLRKRFLDTETPEGSKWPKSKSAIRRERGDFGSFGRRGDTLFDTGQLFRSIDVSKLGTLANNRRVGVTGAVLRDDGKSNFKIGRDHNFGESGNIRREFIGLSDSDVGEVNELLDKAAKAVFQSVKA